MSLVLTALKKQFGSSILDAHQFRGDDTVIVERSSNLEILRFLKEEPQLDFNVLIDLTAVDYLKTQREPRKFILRGEPRFDVVYHLYSLAKNHRVRVKVPIAESDCRLRSVVSLWPIANWFEREAWDMFGMHFDGHPHLKRIMMYEEFVGHPLRKDYPVNKRQPLVGPKN